MFVSQSRPPPRSHASHASTQASPIAIRSLGSPGRPSSFLRLALVHIFPIIAPCLSKNNSLLPYLASEEEIHLPTKIPHLPCECGGKTNLLAGDMYRHVVPQDVIIKHVNLCPKAVLSPVQPKSKSSKKFETNLIGIVKSHVAIILSCTRLRIPIIPDYRCCQRIVMAHRTTHYCALAAW